MQTVSMMFRLIRKVSILLVLYLHVWQQVSEAQMPLLPPPFASANPQQIVPPPPPGSDEGECINEASI